jgi:hypothetical protein
MTSSAPSDGRVDPWGLIRQEVSQHTVTSPLTNEAGYSAVREWVRPSGPFTLKDHFHIATLIVIGVVDWRDAPAACGLL